MSGEEEVKDEVVQEGQEEEVKAEETVEDKLARLEAENAEYLKEKEDWQKREKILSDERANLGRRNKAEADAQMLNMQQQLSQLQSQITGANNQADLKTRISNTDLSDPDAMLNLITDVSTQIADQRINNTISTQSEREKTYQTDYERTIDEMGRNLDPALYAEIRAKLETRTGGEYCHTGIGAQDAMTNFQEARADVFEERVTNGAKPLNLKKDTVSGAGVGGKGTIEETRKKSVKLSPEVEKLAASLGRDKEWAQKALA